MKNKKLTNQIIYTNEARCQDCYRCVRVCPVNAIMMKEGQAQVVSDKCILCGTCIRECPQDAKSYRRDIERVKRLLVNHESIAVSIAPSFATVYEDWKRERIPSLLRKLGFTHISETSEAAGFVAEETAKIINTRPENTHIATACPAFVNYAEKYNPSLVSKLVPVVSPMIAHAMRIKAKFGDDTRVVFIGPCIAKKDEAEKSEFAGLIDAVLTFEELNIWIEEEEVDIKMLETSDFDDLPTENSSLFPLVGGLIRTASLSTDLLSDTMLPVSGVEEINEMVKTLEKSNHNFVVEPLFCAQGCTNGPGIDCCKTVFEKKADLLEYTAQRKTKKTDDDKLNVDLSTRYRIRAEAAERFSEAEIRKVLEKTGKAEEENQLNCGACGYDSCRDKAIAVLMGMAEYNMCLPYVRRMAEQRTDKIIESSPNGIVILDEQLRILHMNPAFRKFFKTTSSICGKSISYLMDPELFIKLREGEKDKIEQTVVYDNYNLVTHQLMYKLRSENQLVGVFVNITKNTKDNQKLDDLKQKTIIQAQELLEHQVKMAQKLAMYLGESTAKGEELVDNLMKYTKDEQVNNKINNNRWLWDIYTSK